MKIETKYEVGQKVYLEYEGEWHEAVIRRIVFDGETFWYDVEAESALRYFSLKEELIVVEEPESFQKSIEFLNMFPEFDEYEKHELRQFVQKLRKEVAKRQKQMEPTKEINP